MPPAAVTGIEQGPINIAQMHVSGVDASLKYRLNTARWGNFSFALDYNNLIGYHEQTYRTDDDKNLRDQKIRSKLRGSVHWENGGPLDLTVYAKRFGSTQAVNWGTCTRFDDGYQPQSLRRLPRHRQRQPPLRREHHPLFRPRRPRRCTGTSPPATASPRR